MSRVWPDVYLSLLITLGTFRYIIPHLTRIFWVPGYFFSIILHIVWFSSLYVFSIDFRIVFGWFLVHAFMEQFRFLTHKFIFEILCIVKMVIMFTILWSIIQFIKLNKDAITLFLHMVIKLNYDWKIMRWDHFVP